MGGMDVVVKTNADLDIASVVACIALVKCAVVIISVDVVEINRAGSLCKLFSPNMMVSLAIFASDSFEFDRLVKSMLL